MRPFLSLLVLSLMSPPAMAADTLKQLLGMKPTEFDWSATASAPRHLPMTVLAANLDYDGGGQAVAASARTNSGWGEPDSGMTGKKQPLPRVLDLLFFSYAEDQFYRATYDLPYEKILKLFQDGYYSPKVKRHVTYSEILVGVAPGGVVAVWLRGVDRQTEVFFNSEAVKVNLPWSMLARDSKTPREQYVRRILEDELGSPEAYAALKKNGPPLGLWDKYRTRYAWQPLFVNLPLRGDLIDVLSYFNGEYDYLPYPLDAASAAATRPVPKELFFVWKTPPTMRYDRDIRLYFNESEIFPVFEKLSAGNRPLRLELRLSPEPLPSGNYDFTIWVSNDKEAVELKQTRIEHYTAPR